MASADIWKDLSRQVIDALNIRAEYEALGVRFAGEPHPSGWQDCYAVDREDNHPSAGVCLEGGAKGHYRDLGGAGLSLGLFDFAARFGGYEDWRAARKEFARKAGVKFPLGAEPKQPQGAPGPADAQPQQTAPSGGQPPVAPPPGAVQPAPPSQEQQILDRIRLQVLGWNADDSLEVFSTYRRAVHRIPDIGRLCYAQLLLYCGEPARDNVHPGRQYIAGRYTLDQVRNAFALIGGAVPLADCIPLGQGVWAADGQVVLVNVGRAAIYANGKLTLIDLPRIGSQLLDFSGSEEWVNFQDLQGYLNLAGQKVFGVKVFQRVAELCGRWYWKHPSDVTVAAALLFATWVQTLWTWRPEVAVTGASSSGKSLLLESFLQCFFGRMGCYIGKPTEASVRQHVRNRSVAILVDEFEGDEKRQRVLDLFRISSRGGVILRGSSDQRGRRYVLRHIPWMGNIESGLTAEADRNRFIILDINRPPRGQHGRITLPNDADLADLGVQALAVALTYFDAARALFDQIKSTVVDGVHGRVVESYSVPASLYAAIHRMDVNAARNVLLDMLGGGRNLMRQGGGGECDLMAALLESHLDLGGGKRVSVIAALSCEDKFKKERETLERHGVALVSLTPGPRHSKLNADSRLFINAGAARRFLLRGTHWADKDIGQLLDRLPGAEYKERVIACKRTNGWLVPAQDWIDPSAAGIDPAEPWVVTGSAEPPPVSTAGDGPCLPPPAPSASHEDRPELMVDL